MIKGTDLTPLLPLIIVIGWACLLLLIDLFIPKDRKGITAVLAALGLVAALVVTFLRFGESSVALSGMIVEDGFSIFLQFIFLATGLAGISLAYDYIKRREIQRGEYYILLLFTVGGMMLMASAGDLVVVFLALELLSIPLYVLSGFARPQVESEEAAMKYFLLGAFASSFVVYGIALTYGATQTTQLGEIVTAVQSGIANSALLVVGAGLILVGLGFKVAAVPFHMWTPDVYQGAPSSVTAFMSVGAKAGGFAALLRVFIAAFPDLADTWSVLVMIIAALTMTWGNVAAIAQPNIKRMLAYSSIAHAGYILMILPAAADAQVTPDAISAALFYILAYAVSNLGAWGVVLAMEKKEGGGLNLEDYAGLGTKNPGLALAMAIFMFSLTGVPPTAGFIGKFYIFRAVIDADLIWLAIVGVLTSLISAYYYLRIIVIMYMRPGEPETRSEAWLDTTVMLTGALTVLLGILPGPLLVLADQANLFAWIP
jgi:NADH-quinone oxidoreductase subunit N